MMAIGKHASIVCQEHFPYCVNASEVEITTLAGQGALGETIALSFSVRSSSALKNLKISIGDLKGPAGRILARDMDLFVVKVWDQAGIGLYRSPSVRVPELLLKDDRASLRDGYRRIFPTWKQYIKARRVYGAPDVRLDGDVRTDLVADTPKQIWLRIRIPSDAPAGQYHGSISFSGGDELPIDIDVLPITLAEPEQDLFLWFKGTLDWTRSQHYVDESVFRAQLRDIFDHGFRSISLSEHKPALLQRALDIAHEIGFCRNVLLVFPYPANVHELSFHGMKPMVYVSDEIDVRGPNAIAAHIREHRKRPEGICSMISLRQQSFLRRLQNDNDIGHAPDVVSYFVSDNLAYFLALSQFPHMLAENVYYYWPAHVEKPNVHRVLSGIFLWKSCAAGISPYCYQHLPIAPNSPYDDFDDWDTGTPADDRPLRDHMATYPARNGSIPTIQWEGMREGITDLRYLTTLQRTLDSAADNAEVSPLVVDISGRLNTFLARVKFPSISILSDSEREPYSEIAPGEFQAFREQIARDIIMLQDALSQKHNHPGGV